MKTKIIKVWHHQKFKNYLVLSNKLEKKVKKKKAKEKIEWKKKREKTKRKKRFLAK